MRRPRISYDDMLLLARKGAQVLHDRSVAMAAECGVPIVVRSCGEKSEGSVVCKAGEEGPITGVTQKKSDRSQLAVVTAVGGALPDSAYEHKAAAALARSGVSVSAVVTGERFLSIFVPREESDRALRIVHDALIAAE